MIGVSILWLLLLSCVLGVTSSIPVSELEALQTIYLSTGGNGWTQKLGWMSTTVDPCGWYGIVCDRGPGGFGFVVAQIDLNSNNLVGTWPLITTLPHLTGLMLWGNSGLSGQLPDLSPLISLDTLYLMDTHLSGPLPPFPNSITWIDVSSSQFTGAVPSFHNNTAITVLRLAGNKFTGPIPEMPTLTKLLYLDLSYNNVTSMPSFAHNTFLKHLDLKFCSLTGSMPEFTTISQIQYLDLNTNYLQGNLPSLSNLPQLQKLDVSWNFFNGTIPEFGSNTMATSLSFGVNFFTGVAPSFANNTALQTLDIGCNYLSLPLPSIAPTTTMYSNCFDGHTSNETFTCKTLCFRPSPNLTVELE